MKERSFNIFRKFFYFALIFLFAEVIVLGQNVSEGEQKVEDEAFMLFTNKEYGKAMPLFSQLLSLHPKDPSYNYGYGVCLIETNTDSKGALKYLKFAQSKSQNPVIFYYIGRSYHLNYQFDKAISNYQQFKQKAPKPDLEEFAVDQKIRMAENGKQLINYVSDLIVLDNKKIKDENFYYSYRLDDFGGKLIVTPKDFKTKVDIKKKYRGITFIWNDAFAFFASYGNNKKGSLDIYETKRSFDGTWSQPQNIGPDINTAYDENFPYLSPDGKSFYFSSKGFNSMGGYDIFKSSFDSTTARFSKPVNMDFPINSPFDDLLYVTDTKNQFAYFASKRETGNDEISVYRIQVDRNRHKKPVESIDEVIEKAKLNVTPLAERPPVNETETADTQAVAQNNNNEVLSFPELKPKSSDPNAEVKQAIEDDLQRITENVQQTKNARDIAIVEAYDKSEQAKGLREKANQILKGISQVPDEQEQAFLKKEAQGMLDDATKLSQEAITAYNLNKHLDQTVQYKMQDAETARNFVKKTTLDANSDSLLQAYNKTRKQFNQNQDKYTTIEKEVGQRNKLIAGNLSKIKQNKTKLTDLESQIKKLDDDITATEQQLANASSQNKPDLQEKLQKQNDRLKQLMQGKTNLKNKTNYLIAQNTGLQNEVKYLRSFKEKTSETEIGEIHQKMAEIDKDALSKNIAETETNLEMDMAQQVAKQQEVSPANETLLAENSQTNQTGTQQNTTSGNNQQENDTNKITTNNETKNVENTSGNQNENSITNQHGNNLQTTHKSANEQMADSLQTLIAQKKEQIKQTTNPVEKQNLQNEVNDLSQILNTVRPQQKETVAQNQTNTQISGNKTATLESRFPDMAIKSDDDAATKYEKTLFKQQYLSQVIQEQETNLENLKNIRKSADSPEPAQSLDRQIVKLSQKIETTRKQLAQTEKQAVVMKQEVEKTQQVKQLSDAELILRASKYTPKNQVAVIDNPADKQELADLEKKTNDQYYNYLQLKKETGDLQKRFDESGDKNIEKQLKEIRQQKEKSFNDYSMNANRLNTLNYYYYDDKIYDNQVVSDNPESQTANKLINEAEYYFNLSKSVQESAKSIDDENLKEKEMEKSLAFQKIAIEKQKHALDLFVSLNNTAYRTPVKTTTETIQLSSDDVNTLKTADKIYYKSTVLEKESQRLNKEAAELKKQAENTFEEKKQAELIAKAKDKKEEAVKKHAQALQNNITADSLKFFVNAPFVDTLFSKNTNKDTRVADLYIKEAYTYNNAAEQLKIRALREKNPDSLLVMNTRIQKFYEKAVNNQQSAIAILSQENSSDFIAVSPITEVNQLTTINRTVDVRNVPEVDEKMLFANLNFNEDDRKTLDLVNKIEGKAQQKISQSKEIDRQIIDLENTIETSDNPKEVNTAKKKLPKLQSKRELLLANAYDDYEPVNYTLFDILKSQLRQAKKGGDKTHRKEAIQLAVNAQKDFQKAARIRDASFMIKDRKKVYKDLQKAYNLENKAIAQIEKSIALYKRLIPEFEEQPLLAKSDTTINTNDFAIKNTGNITPVEVATNDNNPDTTSGNLLANNSVNNNSVNNVSNHDTTSNNINNATNRNENNTNGNQQDTTSGNLLANNSVNNNSVNNVSNHDTTSNNINNATNRNENTTNENNINKVDSSFYNKSTYTNPDTSQIVNNLVLAPIEENDITISFPPQMKSGETYSVTVTINNKKPMRAFARFQIVLPSGLIAKNMSSEGAQTTFDEQTAKFLWMNLPEGKFTVNFQIEANNTTYLADSVHAVFEYAFNDGIKKIDIPEYIKVQPPEILVENRNASGSTNNEAGNSTNNNQNSNTSTANNTAENTNNNQTVKTVSNNDVPFSYVNFNAYTTGNPIPVNPALPSGIIFKVQLGAFSKLIPNNTFKGLNPVVAEKTAGSRFYKYLLGLFQTFDAAQVGRTEVRKMGYRDAFIVAYKDGKRIPVYQARNLISQANDKNYQLLAQEEINKIKNRTGATNTTVTPSEVKTTLPAYTSIADKKDLIYTVQIGVFKKPPKLSYFRGLSPVFDEKTPYGFIRYFTGTFTSVAKATTEKDKIVRLGITDAFVTAYYNGKRISMTEAAKLSNQGKSCGKEEDISYPETIIPQPKSTSSYNKADIWFSVQVGAYKNAVPLDAVSSLVSISRNNEIKQIKDDKGFTLFIIGNFASYSKAKELSEILKNDGVTDCFVIAFGKQQKIPVADAITIINRQ